MNGASASCRRSSCYRCGWPRARRTSPVSRSRVAGDQLTVRDPDSSDRTARPHHAAAPARFCSCPPQGRPKRAACSLVTPYTASSGLSPAKSLLADPIDQIVLHTAAGNRARHLAVIAHASSAPAGRGAEPHVSTTVASTTRWPCSSQSTLLLSTCRSTLSMIATACKNALIEERVIPVRKQPSVKKTPNRPPHRDRWGGNWGL